MKKVNILTIHFGMNHGSFLQTYALQTHLLSTGHEVEIIDYIPERYRIWNGLFKRKHKNFNLPILLAYYPVAVFRESPLRNKFRRFGQKYFNLTRKCSSHQDLMNLNSDADIYIVGSDQVWNEDYNGINEMAYYLDFVPEGKKKISYAASFGKELPYDEPYAKKVLPMLKRFAAISVRESSGVTKLAKYGLSATHVVDPTFLLSSQQWSRFAKDYNETEPYVLVYVIDSAFEKLLQIANEIKEKYGVKLYVICYKKGNDNRVDKYFTTIMPDEFIGLISRAAYVVANSFHGTVFSVIFSRPCIVLGKLKYNTRMISLLEKIGLSRRFIPYTTDYRDIDYDALLMNCDDMRDCKKYLDMWVNESKNFLEEALYS